MRVLFLIRSLEAGGAERQLVLLANGLAQRGHEVGVAVFYSGGILENNLDGPALFLLKKKGRWDAYSFLRSYGRCLKSFQPDILHSYLGTANNLAVLAKLFNPSLSVVWGIRSTSVNFSAYGKLAKIDYCVQRLLSNSPNMIIANSHAGKQDAINSGFSSDSFLVIPNGIDVQHYIPDQAKGTGLRGQWQHAPDDLLIGIVGRLDPMKGHWAFLQAVKIALQKEASLRVVCVGKGPLEPDLHLLCRDLKIEDKVIWAGLQIDMPAVYNALDVCCLASLFGEGFPNVLGEAMACGVPCVTTDVGDAAHIVGKTGLIVPKGNPEAMAEALLMMAQRVKRGELSETRTRIVEHFSLERMVDATETILLEVCA